MKNPTASNVTSGFPWQKCMLGGAAMWMALNFYLAEQLSQLADSEGTNDNANGNRKGGIAHSRTQLDQVSVDPQSQTAHYSFDRKMAEDALSVHGRDAIFQPLRAYVEKKINDTVPGTIDKGNLNEKKPKVEAGRPGKFYVPLPLREGSPEDLRMFEYGHRLRSCNDMPAKFPVDRGLGKHVSRNVNNRDTFSSGKLNVWEEAKEGCPVNADPFLPWIHDIFPDAKGSVIHIIAQNKRRCNSGMQHWEDIHDLEPQVTIMQPVSVKRVDEATAKKLAPNLWSPATENDATDVRYRLAPHEEADSDGMFTRFICRFRAIDYTKTPPEPVVVGETLSTYTYNYEYVNYRKDLGDLSMLTPKGKDNPMFWQSQLRFDCPVPENGDLRSAIASGHGVLSDGTPSVYMDVVPIRTAPRYGKRMSYFTPDMAGETLGIDNDIFKWSDLMTNNIVRINDDPITYDGIEHPPRKMKNGFNPRLFWGDKHVLPRIEASGRWENLPVCSHPGVGYDTEKDKQIADRKGKVKQHKLTACLWASASFTTRGNAQAVSDTPTRLIEWIEFHLLVGFDHIYVYDNTGAHTDETSLESTLFPRFLDSEVTRIDWPCRVCNNNIPAHENTGERSTQYAAESSCRARYGPYTEWMASFDTDEYLVPMGKFNSMREVVDDATKAGTQILTFLSTRAMPIHSYMEPFHEHNDCGSGEDPGCLRVREGSLFAEVYNCDAEKPPKPSWAERAKKQLYRSDYVFAHYVHYSTVTAGLLKTKEEAEEAGDPWYMHFRETRSTDHVTDEIHQAVMLHTKTTVPEYTMEWKTRCKAGFKPGHKQNCRVGFPWPQNNEMGSKKATPGGYGYNCFKNDKLNDFWIPKLHDAIKKRSARIDHLRDMNIL
eukprot:CAMPEP_0181123018 /NCGR_PEP_ID=MMETSP1071-20121207/25641_1 /TAXON_ID=35127 /ORGANISM="Thalassiosira sp., Strain NH16" /LENGTH=880 /DNA_ID=CAMNT_0023208063 /DNA_START=224 /DNA_END=2866 /DNA_ORIENTATION=-